MGKRLKSALFLDLVTAVLLTSCFTGTETQAASQLMDYFTPTPIVDSLSSTCWGSNIGARDQSNGLEDKTLAKWVYWDAGIIKGPDSTYHMFASRWDQGAGHNGWYGSSAIHATSKNLYGPYTDLGTFYDFENGKGHNVTPFLIGDGQYAVSISGVRPARIFTASSLNGPWTDRGDLKVDASSAGFCTQCNLKILHRPDGKFMAVTSNGTIAYSTTLTGPYKVQGPSVYSSAKGIPDIGKMEDPSIWYSGGKYHCLGNQWEIKKAYHFTSVDGMTNWKQEPGYAYDPTADFIRYKNGVVNHWAKLERPEVYIENGHIVAFTFASINVEKDSDKGNDKNGSKVIVVPFDGVAFDSGVAPGTVNTVISKQHVINNRIILPGLGTFEVDNATTIQRVQFTNLLGKKVLEMPVVSGRTMQKCNLPYGFYLINFYVKEKIRSRSFEVLVRCY